MYTFDTCLLLDIKYEIKKIGINNLESLSNESVIQIGEVHNLDYELYNLDGFLIKSSTAITGVKGTTKLDDQVINYFKSKKPFRLVEDVENSSNLLLFLNLK